MADIKELYRAVTTQAPAPPDPIARQRREQARRVRRRRYGGYAVAAAIAVLGTLAVVRATDRREPAPPLGTPSLSPLPFLSYGSYRLNVRTGEVEPFGVYEGGFAWAPSPVDPQRYAFSKEDEEGMLQVWVAGLDEAPRQLTDLPGAGAPVWSPDGHWIAFSGGWELGGEDDQHIYVVEVDTGDVTELPGETSWPSAPSWSPDGSKIVYAVLRTGEAVEGLPFLPKHWQLWEVDVTVDGDRMVAGRPRTLTGDEDAPAAMPSVSPDGTLIAYVQLPWSISQDEELGPHSLRLLHEDGTTVELVPPMPGLADPRWSPDGRTISFKVTGVDGGWEAWTVDVPTGEIRRVSRGWPFNWADADTVHIEVNGSSELLR
jgi:Tol biopolymer transport system component